MFENSIENLINNFKTISNIPRQSGDEEKISNYIKKYAEKLDHEVHQDEYNNLIIRQINNKNNKTIILQGHLDMVYETNENALKKYEEGIELDISEKFIEGKGTSIGADNGIAIAYFMELMKIKDSKIPNIEYILTTGEEVGLNGASKLDLSKITGETMINLDTEDEGIFIVACAGGIRNTNSIEFHKEKLVSNKLVYNIKITSQKGGHSGLDIDKDRINAIVVAGKLLNKIRSTLDFKLGKFECDGKANAIPKNCLVSLAIEKTEHKKCQKLIVDFENQIKNNHKENDSLKIEIKESDQEYFYDDTTRDKVINLINLYPNGPLTYNKELNYLVQTSSNIGAIKENGDEIEILSSIRSSKQLEKYEIVNKIIILTKILKIKTNFFNDYPQWEYQKDSNIRNICLKEYQKLFNQKAKVSAIHAGLECGYFDNKVPNIDLISMGPDIFNPHTTEEKISIDSIHRTWKLLLKILMSFNS
jgi:dipeptidase D